MFTNSFEADFLAQLAVTPIPSDGKKYITGRYISLLRSAQRSYWTANIIYHALAYFITILGVALTTLGAISGNTTEANTNVVYWLIVLIPPFIVVFNKVLYLSDAPKKLVVYEALREKLKYEGYTLLFAIASYAPCKTVDERVALFVSRIETIKSQTVNISDKDGAAIAKELLAFAAQGESESIIVDMKS